MEKSFQEFVQFAKEEFQKHNVEIGKRGVDASMQFYYGEDEDPHWRIYFDIECDDIYVWEVTFEEALVSARKEIERICKEHGKS